MSNKTTRPLFKLGDRVNDPTSGLIERARLNVNVSPEDWELLRQVDLKQGVVQLVTANLIHSFCNVLRKHGITNRTQLNPFHYTLAAFSGRFQCEPFYSEPGSNPEINCKIVSTHEKYLPDAGLDTPASEVRGGADSPPNGKVGEGHESGGVDSSLRVPEIAPQVTADSQRKVGKGRSDAGRRVRRTGGEETPSGSKQDVDGKVKEKGSQQRGARSKTRG